MLLQPDDVARYLCQRGLVTSESVVDGGLTILDGTRRHRSLTVAAAGAGPYLVKLGDHAAGPGSVAHEANTYERYAREAAASMPALVSWDATAQVLILEFIEQAQDLARYHAETGRFPKAHGTALGTSLARLHNEVPSAGGDEPHGEARPAWVLSLHRWPLERLTDVSWGNLELIRTLQRFPEFGRLLDELRAGWRIDAFIHFDLRWDNVLVTRGRRPRVKIVDWEFAGPGDAAWDTGTVMSNYLAAWVHSIPLLGETMPQRLVELARHPLERMQPAIAAFWAAYTRARGFDAASADESLLRAVRYSGARLLETVYADTQTALRLSAHSTYLLQLSLNILKQPLEAAVHLLGLSPGAQR